MGPQVVAASLLSNDLRIVLEAAAEMEQLIDRCLPTAMFAQTPCMQIGWRENISIMSTVVSAVISHLCLRR